MSATLTPKGLSLFVSASICLTSLVGHGATFGGLQFDGANDYVTFGQAPALGLSQLTIETWFKRTGTGASADTGTDGVIAIPLVAKGRGEADGNNKDMNYFLGLRASDGVLVADFEDAATGANHPVAGTTVVPMNTWQHAAVTYDGTTWNLCLNGALEATLVVGQSLRSDSIQHASLASALNSSGTPEGYFAGILDEVRIWNYARSATDIANDRYTQIPSAAGLVGRWALDETSGTTAADSSVSGVNGTLINGPVWVTGFDFTPFPQATLVSPVDQELVKGTTVNFEVQAHDEFGLLSATLYVGSPAETFVFTGPTQTEDTYLSADTANSNYQDDTPLEIDGATPHAHAVMRFPTIFGPGQVPAGSTIASATLRVYCSNPGHQVRIYRLVEAWTVGEATWNERQSGIGWAVAGAEGASHDATEIAYTFGAAGWYDVDITTFAQAWSAGQPNYGLVFIDSGTDGVEITSSESGTPPTLTITLPSQPMQAGETKPISGTDATVTFTTTLQDSQDYIWNCLVQNTSGGQAWAPANFQFTVDVNYPNDPGAVFPADGATGVPLSPMLQAQVSDPNGDTLSVAFYGRSAVPSDPDFTLAVLPDTQFYSESYPAIFTAQTTWIRNEVQGANSRNIVLVAHEGDVVNTPTTTQYDRANTSMSLFDGIIPYGILRGNHDSDSEMFNQYFPYTRYDGIYPWYGGHYPANGNDNNYQKTTIGTQNILLMNLSYAPAADAITWADGVIKAHPEYKVIIVTHAYLNTDGSYVEPIAGNIWNGLVVPNANVCMVLCGHNHDEFARLDTTPDGRVVPQLLADYQSRANGGNGWLRLMRFSPSQNILFVETYSPYLDQFETDANSQFELDLPMNGFQLLGQVEGVASGATAQFQWSNLELGAAYEWYVVVTDSTGRSIQGLPWSFTTGGGDVTPPAITDVAATGIAARNATITWTTDEPASSVVDYGYDSSYGNTVSDPALVTSHSVELTGLVPGTTYFYKVTSTDGSGNSASVVDLTFATEPNQAPVAADDIYVTPEDTGLTVLSSEGVLANDSDLDGDALTVTLVDDTDNGTLTLNLDGSFTYTPNLNFNGTDSFTYVASDGALDSAVATVTITVSAVNDPPVLTAIGNQTITEGIELSFTATAGDPDVPANALTFSLAGAVPPGASIDPMTGIFAWTPTEAQGPGVYTFDVEVSDGALTDSETITVTVNEVNIAPVLAAIGNQTVSEVTELRFTATATDADLPAQTLTFSLAGTIPEGATISPAGVFTWTPTEAQGPGSYVFDVVASDGALTDSETITVTVNEVNIAPVAGSQSLTTDQDIPLAITLTATDADGNPLTYRVTGGPDNGTLSGVAPDLTYTPNAGYSGPDSFTFVANDGTVDSDPGLISITVVQPNHAPVAYAGSDQQVNENVLVTLDGSASSDEDGDTLTYTWTQTGGPTVSLSDPNAAKPTFASPSVAQNTDLTFSLTVSDGEFESMDSVVVTITYVDDNAYAVANPQMTVGTVAGNFTATVAADGASQSLTEAVVNTKQKYASLEAEYALHTTAIPALISRMYLGLTATWTSLDDRETWVVEIWNNATLSWQDISADILADGLFEPAGNYTDYVSANGDIFVRFKDSSLIRNEALSTLSIDQLYAWIDTQASDLIPPAAPAGLAAVPGEFQVSLDWDDNSEPDLAGYNVYRAGTAGGPYQKVNTSLITSSDFADAGVAQSTDYYYVVTAVDSSGNESAPSAEVTATTTDGVPAPPTGLAATPGNNQVVLNWDDHTAPDLAGYNVYRSTTAGGTYILLNAGGLVAASAFTDDTAANGVTYYYVVTAMDGGGNESGITAEVSATPSDMQSMHVANINMALALAGKNYKATASVSIVDLAGSPVVNAVVTGDWYFNGSLLQSGAVATTDAAGLAAISSPPVKASSGQVFTFQATHVELAGYTYDAGLNAETSDSIAVP